MAKVLYVAGKAKGVTEFMQRVLKMSGVDFSEVNTAEDAKTEIAEGDYRGVFIEALQLSSSSNKLYPGLDVLECAKEKGLPSLVLTGGGPDLAQKAKDIGKETTAVLSKPIGVEDLQRALTIAFLDG